MKSYIKVATYVAIGCFVGASFVYAGALTLKSRIGYNTWAQYGYGISGSDSFDGTFIAERTGQRNGVADTGPEHPALWARTDMNNPASAFRATSKNGVDAVIGNQLPGGASPSFTADGTPTLFAGDQKLNTSGAKNNGNFVKHVAIESRGAIKLCGKSSSGDSECTSQAYLYLEDGSGDLVIKFANGDKIILAEN
ncbi:MAG: hypothetical protein AAFY56_17035 [Pseudomonadota bacterium]